MKADRPTPLRSIGSFQLVVLVVGLSPGFVAGCGARSPMQPGERFDLGPVFAEDRDRVAHVFRVQNTTGRPVKILSVDATCSCTTKRLAKYELASGEATELEIATRMPQSYADTKLFCTLKTDHPAFPEWVYSLHFVSIPRAEISPSTLNLGSLRDEDFDAEGRFIAPRDNLFSVDATIYGKTQDALKITKIEAEGLAVRVEDSTHADRLLGNGITARRFHLRIEPIAKGEGKNGVQFGSIVVKTPAGAQAGASASWRVIPAITAAPSHLHFGTLRPHAASDAKRLTVLSSAGKPFRILSVEIVPESLGHRLRVEDNAAHDEPAVTHILNLTLDPPPGGSGRMLSGMLQIDTDEPRRPSISIPWSALVRSQEEGPLGRALVPGKGAFDENGNPALCNRGLLPGRGAYIRLWPE